MEQLKVIRERKQMTDGLWQDKGRASQGKIITAILQDRNDDAVRLLSAWSDKDLIILDQAASKLRQLIARTFKKRKR